MNLRMFLPSSKRFIIIVLMAVIILPIYATTPYVIWGNFAIEHQNTLNEYKEKYIGDTVVYLPSGIKNVSYDDFSGKIKHPYVIRDFVGNDSKFVIKLKDAKSNDVVEIQVYNEMKTKLDKVIYCITPKASLPLLLLGRFNKEKTDTKGKTMKDSKGNDVLKIVDINVGYVDDYVVAQQSHDFQEQLNKNQRFLGYYPTIYYMLESKITGDTIICDYVNCHNNTPYIDNVVKYQELEQEHRKSVESSRKINCEVAISKEEDGKIARVYEAKGNAADLYKHAQSWATKYFENYNDIVQVDNVGNSRIILAPNAKLAGPAVEIGMKNTSQLTFSLTIEFKEGRYRVLIDNIHVKYIDNLGIPQDLDCHKLIYFSKTEDNKTSFQKESISNLKWTNVYLTDMLTALHNAMVESSDEQDDW